MGIEPFLVASGVECVVAQRLVRRLCDCKQPQQQTDATLLGNGNGVPADDGPPQAFEPVGCVRCCGTGYRGRVGVYQVLELTEEVRGLILEKASADAVSAVAREQGMRTVREDGLEKVRRGLTSLAEVLRVTGSDKG